VTGSCEQGNETWTYIQDGEYLDQMSDYKLFKDDSPSWSYSVVDQVISRDDMYNCSYNLKQPSLL